MSDQFIGEIRMFPFGFAPKYWANCDGTILPIQQNQALFALLGTSYGGDGVRNFGLPNLQARVPMHSHNMGQAGGEYTHTLTPNEVPAHTHPLNAVNAAGASDTPITGSTANMLAASKIYGPASDTQLRPETVPAMGGGQTHENRQPFLVIGFCIALSGIFPSRN